jgi:4-hydroxy-L-threonine phosphate dehydrogenase PdxA
MMFNPHKLGIHKVLKHIPLNAVFDAPYKRALKKAVNIADLRLIAKARAHKVRERAGTARRVFVLVVRLTHTNAA